MRKDLKELVRKYLDKGLRDLLFSFGFEDHPYQGPIPVGERARIPVMTDCSQGIPAFLWIYLDGTFSYEGGFFYSREALISYLLTRENTQEVQRAKDSSICFYFWDL